MYYRVKFDPAAMGATGSALALRSSFSGSLVLPSLNAYPKTGLRGVGFCLMVATALHAIATGNLRPPEVSSWKDTGIFVGAKVGGGSNSR